MKRVVLLSALLGISCLGGCATNEESTCKADMGPVDSVNKYCVVVPEDTVKPNSPRTMWRGQKVGFCCAKCVPQWDAMSDAEKDAALARVINKK